MVLSFQARVFSINQLVRSEDLFLLLLQAMQQQLFAQQFGMQNNNGAERDQLRDLTEAMQRQLALLTRAVDELKDVSSHVI